MNDPVYLALGLHAHQPVGNFGHVLQEHLERVYGPFLDQVVAGDLLPLTLHLSGPLLEWLESNHPQYLDRIGNLVTEGRVELLLAGYYEPILPALPKEDRIQQIRWMQEALSRRFGAEAKGLWLTERVWEPDLAEDLVDAGVEYVLVDDRHFAAAGFSRQGLHRPFYTEFGGKRLGVFAIDETLRYFLPFRPPADTVSYLREVKDRGQRLAVAADDIEKFGGWPGTHEWVYERGWLRDFAGAMNDLKADGTIELATFGQALRDRPSGGLVYLPSASYREMEEWTLPPEATSRLERMKEILDEADMPSGDSPLLRGSHWRNFLVRYPEANRMHKKGLALSRLCRERGNPQEARRAIGRAQCNDAYWHGVFGGLYLRHLRDSIWDALAEAEGRLRQGEPLSMESVDVDLDGFQELWIHSGAFSAVVSPARGGAVEEFTVFARGVNLANTLTRRREAYHFHSGSESDDASNGEDPDGKADNDAHEGGEGTPSIHDLEGTLRLSRLPPVDTEARVLFVERVIPPDLTLEDYQEGDFRPLLSLANRQLRLVSVREARDEDVVEAPGEPSEWLELAMEDPAWKGFGKMLTFREAGTLEVGYRWNPTGFPEEAFFTTELSLGAEARVEGDPAVQRWTFPISTFSKSERGFDQTVQGHSVTLRWPIQAGQGWVRISVP